MVLPLIGVSVAVTVGVVLLSKPQVRLAQLAVGTRTGHPEHGVRVPLSP